MKLWCGRSYELFRSLFLLFIILRAFFLPLLFHCSLWLLTNIKQIDCLIFRGLSILSVFFNLFLSFLFLRGRWAITLLLLLGLHKLLFLLFNVSKSSLFQLEVTLFVCFKLRIDEVNDLQQLCNTLDVDIWEGLGLDNSGNSPPHHEASLINVSSDFATHFIDVRTCCQLDIF